MEQVQWNEFYYLTLVIGSVINIFISYLGENINGILVIFAESKMLYELVIILETESRFPKGCDEREMVYNPNTPKALFFMSSIP